MAGYIKLHRKFMDWEWFDDLPTFKLFITLLLTVNYTDKKWHGEEVKRGEIITSLQHLSSASGLSIRQVRTALDKLIATGEIEVIPTYRYSHIKVLNYAKYQDTEDDDRQANDTVVTQYRQANDTVSTSYRQQLNKDNKEKKERNNNTLSNTLASGMEIPSAEQLADYAKAIGYTSFDPAVFMDYYNSNGWMVGKNVMHDWMAQVRIWQKREYEKTAQKQSKGSRGDHLKIEVPAYAKRQKEEGLPKETKASEEKLSRIREMQEKMAQG